MNTCAKCGFENDNNVKTCVNCLTDLHWAKVNLGKFHGNAEDTRKIGIISRREHGLPVPDDELTPLKPIQITKNDGNIAPDNIETTQIGAIAGFTTIFLLLLGFQMVIMSRDVIYRFSGFLRADFVVSLIGIPFGIIGAFIGKNSLKTSKAAKIGGVMGACLAIVISILTGLIFFLCPILGGC